jgi:hypothetical protein
MQRSANERLLVVRCPPATEPGHDFMLDLEPERLSIHEQPVHVEQHSLKLAASLRA